ncbi:unnamed protein product [Dovyalis caffra]|uniref:Uncharacterized protein n=1 Tax=Dovyalis caffra TaxID=77055 RepID=A0AAV1RHF1_9ROSI|nr:unnamed protein product [Dovyalis caffra]
MASPSTSMATQNLSYKPDSRVINCEATYHITHNTDSMLDVQIPNKDRFSYELWLVMAARNRQGRSLNGMHGINPH